MGYPYPGRNFALTRPCVTDNLSLLSVRRIFPLACQMVPHRPAIPYDHMRAGAVTVELAMEPADCSATDHRSHDDQYLDKRYARDRFQRRLHPDLKNPKL